MITEKMEKVAEQLLYDFKLVMNGTVESSDLSQQEKVFTILAATQRFTAGILVGCLICMSEDKIDPFVKDYLEGIKKCALETLKHKKDIIEEFKKSKIDDLKDFLSKALH